ncbi:MAG: hypothetical protein IH602_06550 [Bryobacteraceae bacterium]|nr:hypothetical protein [Bryobacteraceae bacterium]
MDDNTTRVRVKGRPVGAPSRAIGDRVVVTRGSLFKIATIKDEELVAGPTILDPASFVSELKSGPLGADLLTFTQRLPDTVRRYSYPVEWEDIAAIPITTYSNWLKTQVEDGTRRAVKRATKLGVETRIVQYDDTFVDAVRKIYDESPSRQGKRFWHYREDVDVVKSELASYLERSTFIGAYYENELIGFLKMTDVESTATMTLIFSAQRHFDKKPNNALIAKAVELSELRGMAYLTYGQFVYRDPNSTLTHFKRRNGFQAIPVPRYYVPLTVKGSVVLKFGLHHGVAGIIPPEMLKVAVGIRAHYSKIAVLRKSAHD